MSEQWDYKKAGLDLDKYEQTISGIQGAHRPHAARGRDPTTISAAEGREGRRRVRQHV